MEALFSVKNQKQTRDLILLFSLQNVLDILDQWVSTGVFAFRGTLTMSGAILVV